MNSALLGTEPHDLSRMIAGIARLTTALRPRERQLQAVACHPSQALPGSVLWRRLELLGDHEHLRYLRKDS